MLPAAAAQRSAHGVDQTAPGPTSILQRVPEAGADPSFIEGAAEAPHARTGSNSQGAVMRSRVLRGSLLLNWLGIVVQMSRIASAM